MFFLSLTDPKCVFWTTQVARSQKRRKVHDPGSSECIGDNQYMDWVRMHKVMIDDGVRV